MSDTILSGNFTVYYLDENRQKRIKWSGSASGTNTMNQLYSALQDLFDESLQMDDGIPISAQTPVEYTIGKIDSGDSEPWFIDYETMQHLKSGALKTTGWTRSVGTNTGIVAVKVTAASNLIVAGDVGLDITHADGDAGTLLQVIDTGGISDYLIIRPDSSAAPNNFDSVSGNLTCNTHTAPQEAAATTGEQIWANLYSLGTIEPDTHIYLYQGLVSDATRARVYSVIDQTQDWWGDGHIDICVPIRNYKVAGNPVIDGGYITVFGRKYTTFYDSYEVATSTTSGGRNPIPLATAPDLDNTTGYKSITTTAVTVDDFLVGDEIQGGTSGARAIITEKTGVSPTYTFHYYLIDDPLTDFQTAAETISNNDGTGSATKDGIAPANQGPALAAWYTAGVAPSANYTSVTVDIDDNGTAEGYGITLNCTNNPLDEVYEWIKFTFRRGNLVTTNSDGIEAEQYIGGEVYLDYSGAVSGGTIAEGDDVTQATSGATGIVISHDTVNKEILLRNIRGTFSTSYAVTSNDNSGSITPDNAAVAFSPKKQAPLGTFAGGTFFGARGVVLSNWISADENKFQLTDTAGNIRQRPVAITLEVTNLIGTDETTITDDRVAVFRLTGSGGDINKTEYSAAGGEVIGAATLVVDTAISVDVPGKTTGGVLRIRDNSNNNKEYRLRYSSWAISTFTLANIIIASADAGTDTNTIVKAGAFATAKRGDLVVNHTRAEAVSYVTQVISADSVEIYPAIALQQNTDSIELNCIPIAVDTLDSVYIPLIDKYAIASSASVSIVYSSAIYFRVVVRNVANAIKIIPFSTDGSTTGTGKSVSTIRTPDSIYT